VRQLRQTEAGNERQYAAIGNGACKSVATGTFSRSPETIPERRRMLDETSPMEAFNFTGFATSEYVADNIRHISTSDRLDLTIDTTSTPVVNGTITFADGRDSFSLDATTDGGSRMTYIDKNNFTIKDFDTTQGYMIADNTISNDYVSWGYWAINSSDSTQLTTKKNYWVGGSQADADAAISHIAGLTTNTQYTYAGKVLGDVEEAGLPYTIDSSTSNVQLKFDFGGGVNALNSASFINFIANGKQWNLQPTLTTPTVTNGTFSGGLTGTVTTTSSTPVTSGAIQGQFYGDQAQAVGGTFNAATSTAAAVGVFKATRLGVQ